MSFLCFHLIDAISREPLDDRSRPQRPLNTGLRFSTKAACASFASMFLALGNPDLVPILVNQIRIGRSYWISIHDDLRMASRFGTVIGLIKEWVSADRALFASGVG